MQLLLRLVLEGTRDNSHTFIANIVAPEVQLTDGFATLQYALKLV